MAVLKMQRISICALKKDRKSILEKLQSLGVLEISHVLEEDEDFHKMDTAGRRLGFEKAAAAADQALDLLDKYAPEKKSMFAALEGKKLISAKAEEKVREERRDLLRIARRISDLDRERAEQLASITKLENSIAGLEPWLALDVPRCFSREQCPEGQHWKKYTRCWQNRRLKQRALTCALFPRNRAWSISR